MSYQGNNNHNQQQGFQGYNNNQQQGYQGYNQQQGYQDYNQQQGYQGYNQQQQGYNQQQGYQGYKNYNQQQGYQGYNQQQQGYNQQQSYQNYNQGGYNNNNIYNKGGNYNNKNNYNNYNNYNQQQGYQGYNQQQGYQQQSQGQGMTLEDFQKQQTQQAAAKPKKTLKLVSSSGIKLANATKTAEPKKEEAPKEEAAPAAAETPKEEATELPNVADLKISEDEKKTQSTEPTASPSASPAASEATHGGADSLIKEQEDEVDEEVVNDMFGGKDHVSLIFMGHVDAGKSTMGGNLLYLTGSVDKRTIEKYEREAKDAGRQGWYLSWVMDTNKEERNDGKTIEVGKAYFETEKRRYTILDAPGHKMYVSEMIGGASQADVGVLVISARKGEYETGFERGGQTREHALLAKTQGVNKMVVVINKMDDPTVNWSEERYNQCTSNVANFLKAIGYKKEDVIFMPVSGFSGAGLKDRVDPKECPWYTGPSLLEYLDGMNHMNRSINAPFMLPIAGKMRDLGTVVEGKIESGHIKKGQSTLLMPNRTPIEIQNIYNETEAEVDMAMCGEQVKLRIKGVEEEDVSPGFVLTSPKNPIKSATKFVAEIAIVELKSIISAGFSCVMHLHTAIEEVVITRLLHKLEKGTNRKSKRPPAFAKKGMKIIAVLETEAPVCVETYEDYPQLGRFTLRDQGTTIAIGKIIKVAENK
ncbi:eukaryotic peptide chain release factor GTP-binding subunit [Monosporozyma unispora]|nr:translation termination factor GTPase eRF3 [Kazachstania unispora]